jgi:hypothetical protein
MRVGVGWNRGFKVRLLTRGPRISPGAPLCTSIEVSNSVIYINFRQFLKTFKV